MYCFITSAEGGAHQSNATLSSHGFNPRFNISYHVNDDLMIYGEAAKGFRYGGANQPVPLGTTGIAGQCTQNLANYAGMDANGGTHGDIRVAVVEGGKIKEVKLSELGK